MSHHLGWRHRGQSKRRVVAFRLSLSKFPEHSSPPKNFSKAKKTSYRLLNQASRVGRWWGQAVVFTPYFPPSYLFSCWKTMWGKVSVHCVGERQSLTSLLAVQQCTLQQPVMCRLLPHICIIIFFSFFFYTGVHMAYQNGRALPE